MYIRSVVISIGLCSLVLKIGRVRVVAFTDDIFEVLVDHTGVGTDFELTETGESQQFVLIVNVALFRGRQGIIVVPGLPMQTFDQRASGKLHNGQGKRSIQNTGTITTPAYQYLFFIK